MSVRQLKLLSNGAKHIFCLTHAPDFDGISSAALLVRYLSAPESGIFFGYPQSKDLVAMLEKLAALKPSSSLVITTDLAVNDDAIPDVTRVLSALKRDGNRIAWIDHHPWSDQAVQQLRAVCDILKCGEGNKCAAELVIDALGVSDEYAMMIGRLAHTADFALKGCTDTPLLEISNAITYLKRQGEDMSGLRRMVKMVSEGDLDGEYIMGSALEYTRETELEVPKLQHDCAAYDVNGLRVGIGYAKGIKSDQACKLIQEQLNTEVEVFVDTNDYSVKLRSRAGIDCSPLARALGGGGHPQAAGGQLSIKSDSGIEGVIRQILDAAKASLKKGETVR